MLANAPTCVATTASFSRSRRSAAAASAVEAHLTLLLGAAAGFGLATSGRGDDDDGGDDGAGPGGRALPRRPVACKYRPCIASASRREVSVTVATFASRVTSRADPFRAHHAPV